MPNILSRNLLIICIIILLFNNNAISQINASYGNNIYACNCINITLVNSSSDTVYVISQSNSIQYWDSCFAYTIFPPTPPRKGYDLNITYYYRDMDNYNQNYIYLFPDSSINFGARINNDIIKDSLFISMYVYSIAVKIGETAQNMKTAVEKTKKSRRNMLKEWRSYYCRSLR